MDFSAIVSLVSVITSAGVTVANLLITATAQKEANQQKHRYELELENLRHLHENKEKLREKQYNVLSSMAPYGLAMNEDPDTNREDLYTLALNLAACSNPEDTVGESANALLRALTTDYKDKDKISWTYLIESCARSVNYSSSGPAPLAPTTTGQPNNKHTSQPRKERQSGFAKFGKAFLAGWREFQSKIRS